MRDLRASIHRVSQRYSEGNLGGCEQPGERLQKELIERPERDQFLEAAGRSVAAGEGETPAKQDHGGHQSYKY